MTQPKITPLHQDLTFHGPLSDERARRLIRTLAPLDGAHVVDLGCGWAELLLRILESAPTATGHGVDRDEEAIEHARANAHTRGLTDRVVLESADVATWSGDPSDVVIVNGASQVWGGPETEHTATALRECHALLRPADACCWARASGNTSPPRSNWRRCRSPGTSTVTWRAWSSWRWSTATACCRCARRLWTSGTSSSPNTHWPGNAGYWPTRTPHTHQRSGPKQTDTATNAYTAGAEP